MVTITANASTHHAGSSTIDALDEAWLSLLRRVLMSRTSSLTLVPFDWVRNVP